MQAKLYGYRAHDYGAPFQNAASLAEYYTNNHTGRCLQIVLAKAFPSLGDSTMLCEKFASDAGKTLQEAHFTIPVLGCYFNPVQPSAQLLEQQLRRFEQHLRIQNAIGASCVGTETGSIDPTCAYHPDTQEPWVLDRFCHSLERLLAVAEKEHATVGIEAVAKNHTISTIGRVKHMIERFDSPALGFIFDLANLTPFTGIPETDGSFRTLPSTEAQTAFVTEYLSIVKNRLIAIHVKNYKLGNDGIKIGDLPADEGVIDWKTIIPLIEKSVPGTPCILEGAFPHADDFMSAL